mmetsp:Transcript_17672/g.48548  ORF Transcript_17672/g.48548 Transcript_17672/m.48548 type:complete len:203 (-) Transcript_17672:57-665(-)
MLRQWMSSRSVPRSTPRNASKNLWNPPASTTRSKNSRSISRRVTPSTSCSCPGRPQAMSGPAPQRLASRTRPARRSSAVVSKQSRTWIPLRLSKKKRRPPLPITTRTNANQSSAWMGAPPATSLPNPLSSSVRLRPLRTSPIASSRWRHSCELESFRASARLKNTAGPPRSFTICVTRVHCVNVPAALSCDGRLRADASASP